MRFANSIVLSALALVSCATPPAAQRADASQREVTVRVENSIRSFARCIAHALDHSRPDLKHVAVPLGDGTYEVRSRNHKTTLMVNHVRQAGREMTIATRVHASPPAEKWYEGVDEGIDECNGLGGGPPH